MPFLPIYSKQIINKLSTDNFEILTHDTLHKYEKNTDTPREDPRLYESFQVTESQKLFSTKTTQSPKLYTLKYEDKSINFKWSYFVIIKAIDKKLWIDKLLSYADNSTASVVNLGEIKGVKQSKIAKSILFYGFLAVLISLIILNVNSNIYTNTSDFQSISLGSITNIPIGQSVNVESIGTLIDGYGFAKTTTTGRRLSQRTTTKFEIYVFCKDNFSNKTFVVEISGDQLLQNITIETENTPSLKEILEKTTYCTQKANAKDISQIQLKNSQNIDAINVKAKELNIEEPTVFYPNYEFIVLSKNARILANILPSLLLLIPLYFYIDGNKKKNEVIRQILK
jgi:hypothetical protein